MHDRLMTAIRAVRNRWRLRVALRGVAIVMSAGLAVALAALYGMDRFRFAPAAVSLFRLLVYLAVVALAWRYLVRPLRRRVGDGQVALYLEEHEPELSGQIAGAVEFGGAERAGTSPALVQNLVRRAIERLDAPGGARVIERPAITRSAMVLGGAALMAAMLAVVQPAFVARGAAFLLPLGGAPATPYWIAVLPGDTIMARGADLTISAELHNFTAERVELAVRRGAGDWERWDMPTDEATGRRALILFGLDSTTTYFVEAGGVRTAPHTVEVRDLPYVRSLSLEIRAPAWAGVPAIRQDESGDVAALPGSRVVVTVTPTMAATAGALVFDAGDTIPLTAGPQGTLSAAFVVRREDGYRVFLAGADRHPLPASSPYLVTLLEDHPPQVTIARPGRDVNATSIEELFTEVRAEDDYGVRDVELAFSVNGGPERSVSLYRGAARRQLTAPHTFYLEEYSLSPGDVVSYFARAREARPDARPAASDIYFVTIRPFDRSFREAQQGGQQQGEGESDVGQLSQRQREIVAATFNLQRDSARYTPDEFRQNMATLALAQGRLREEVATLAGRLVSRGVAAQDSTLRQVADILPRAVSEMQAAETGLGRRDAAAALPPEQRALQHLQRAETIFRREQQVARGQGGGGGGGGPQGDPELSELFELDLDRMRNQYEQVQRGQREQASREVDETLERLRELARRQQQEMERRQAASRQGGGAAGPTGNAQRQMADEAAEMARRLERLSREQNQPELAEAARRLEQAADAMRRAAADRGGAQAASALDRLRDARRQLEQNRSAGLQRDAQNLAERARRLAQQQRDVQGDVGRLSTDNEQARAERVRRLLERKEQMAGEVAGIASELDRLGREARNEQPEAARQMREAATAARDSRLEDKIRYSRGVVQGRDADYARNFEEIIASDIERFQRQIETAAGAVGESREQRLGRSLDRAGDLANAMESMGRRAGEQSDSADARRGEGQDGRQGARGEQGQSRQGQDGQAGQRGQRGQQGQEGPGGQRGEQGSPRGGTPGAPTADGSGPPRGGNAAPDGRQMRSELGRRRAELDSLRGRLEREGVDVGRLDELGRAMARMDRAIAAGAFQDVADLSRQIGEGLKEFEFDLRRQLAGRDPRRPQLPGADDVAPEYRRMVEEYYRSLGSRPR